MVKRAVAVVGLGGIAQAHLRGWAAQPEAEVRLLCDVRPEQAEQRRGEFGLHDAQVVSRLEDVLAGDVELVDLCTPSALHASQSVACLEAGKHVLCEKPMADSLAEAERIAAAAARRPETVYLCEHRMLFDPLVIAAREQLPAVGRPFWMRLRTAHALPISPTIAATGAFLDIGYHPLYTALHFLGPAQTAFALRHSLVRPELADDNGLYVLEHQHGVSVLEGSFSSIGPMGGNRPFELYGETGTLIGNWAPKASLTLYPGQQGGEVEPGMPIEVPDGSWIVNAIRHFLEVVEGVAQPVSGAEAALETMRTYDAALRSLTSAAKEAVRR